MTGVWEVVNIQELKQAGLNKKTVSEMLSLDRGTVAKYWNCRDPEKQPQVYHRSSILDPYKEYIISRLEKWPQLSAERLFLEIKSQGYTGSDRTVRRYVSKIRPQNTREYKPYETLPGEQAQIDWGHMGEIVEDGRRKKLYVFVFCLGWSRQRYVEFITSLNSAVFNGCLHRALQYVGGVPEIILFDNAKTVVSERVGTAIRFTENLMRVGLKYGFTPKACWVNDAESKGKVESNVKYVKRGFYYARDFTNVDDLNNQALNWLEKVANAKVHGTTGCIPAEQLIIEQAYLKPLPPINEALPVTEKRQATKTALISIDANKYSVPAQLARRTVHYLRYEDRIEIQDDKGVIAKHPLVRGKNKTIICDEHYPLHDAPAQRPRNGLQAKFEALAPEAADYLQGLSTSRHGHLREQMEKIINLAKQHDSAIVSSAMKRSLAFGAFGYGILKRIMDRQIKAPHRLPEPPNSTGETNPSAPYSVHVEKRDTSYYGGISK